MNTVIALQCISFQSLVTAWKLKGSRREPQEDCFASYEFQYDHQNQKRALSGVLRSSQASNPKPSFHLIFQFPFHLILHYWGNTPLKGPRVSICWVGRILGLGALKNGQVDPGQR